MKLVRIAKCKIPFYDTVEAGLKFNPNGNSYRRKRQEKAFKYLKKGNALVALYEEKPGYKEIEFSPETFIKELLDRRAVIFNDFMVEDSFILIGAREFAEVARRSEPDFGFNFRAPVSVKYRHGDDHENYYRRSSYQILGIDVVVSINMSGILVLNKADFRSIL